MNSSNRKVTLPKDLAECEHRLSESLIRFVLSEESRRIQVNILFEGLKLQPIIFRLVEKLQIKGINTFVLFSDFGNTALSKRDFPNHTNNIFSFKDLLETDLSKNNNLIIAFSPQPYEYEDFESLCKKIDNRIVMINGKLEETSIGIGSVGRERRINFIKSWQYAFLIQPFNKGALLFEYPYQWSLFSYSADGYRFKSSFTSKPDKEEIDNVI